MTTSQETMTDAARRGQEAITSVMQSYFDMFVPDSDPDTKMRSAFWAVDKMYDFAGQMLVTHKEITKGWLDFYMSAATKAAYAAQDAAKDVEYAAKDIQENATRTDRRPNSAKEADATPKKS